MIQILFEIFKRQANLVYCTAVNSLILLYGRDIQSSFSGCNLVKGKTDLLADHRNTIVLCFIENVINNIP